MQAVVLERTGPAKSSASSTIIAAQLRIFWPPFPSLQAVPVFKVGLSSLHTEEVDGAATFLSL